MAQLKENNRTEPRGTKPRKFTKGRGVRNSQVVRHGEIINKCAYQRYLEQWCTTCFDQRPLHRRDNCTTPDRNNCTMLNT